MNQKKDQATTISRVLDAISKSSANSLIYLTALLGIGAVTPSINLPPELAVLATSMGFNAISTVIDRVASNKDISDDEIVELVKVALKDSHFDNLLQKDEFWHGFAQLRKSQNKISKQNELILRKLKEIEKRKVRTNKNLLKKAPDRRTQASQKFNVEKELKNYLEWLTNHYGKIHPIYIQDQVTLKSLYIPLYVNKPSKFYFDETTQGINEDIRGNHQSRKMGDDLKLLDKVVKEEKRLFILGAPGTGKSTYIKHLAIQAVQNTSVIPIVLILREKNKNWTLEKFIKEELNRGGLKDISNNWLQWMRDGRVLLLIDGLDEINDIQRKNIQREIERLATHQEYKQNHFVVTCRIAATDFQMNSFKYTEIVLFNEEQIRTFISNWFRNKTSQEYEMFEALKDSNTIFELARTPLLLSVLCLLFEQHNRLYNDRAELYERAIETLLSEWDESKGVTRLKFSSNQEEINFLSWIAWKYCGEGTDIKASAREREIIRWGKQFSSKKLDINIVLKKMQSTHGILRERANKIYTFSHLTFQEYFTARYILENNQIEILFKHLEDKQWREIIILTAAQLYSADDFLTALTTRISMLFQDNIVLQKILEQAWLRATNIEKVVGYKESALRAIYIESILTGWKKSPTNKVWNMPARIARKLDPFLDLDMQITVAVSNTSWSPSVPYNLSQANRLCQQLGLTELGKSLIHIGNRLPPLHFITHYGSPTSWSNYTNLIREATNDTRDLSKPETVDEWLSSDDLTKHSPEDRRWVNDFVELHLLLADCLQVATIQDKEKIDSLILKPAVSKN